MKTVNSYTLITGGTEGIGYELAKIFAAHGHHLILVARNQQQLDATAMEIKSNYPVDVFVIAKDLFDPENAFEVYDEVKANNFQVDILVNNAGQGLYGEFAETDIWRELSIIQLNISSLVVLTKAFLLDMLQRGEGKILNLSSIASKTPGPWQSVYHGTKAFVQSFTEAVRAEVKEKGVTLTALLPGATDTDFFNKAGMTDSKVVQEGKLSDPAGVAKAGYEALMKGDDMVVSGFANKVQVAVSGVIPDSTLANKMYTKQEPSDKSQILSN